MPKIILTQAQREEERRLAYQRSVTDALAIARNRDFSSVKAIADKTGVPVKALRRMLHGDYTAPVPADRMLVLLELARHYMRVSQRDGAAAGIE